MTTRARSIVIARRVADGALLTLFALVAVGLVLGRVLPMTEHRLPSYRLAITAKVVS